MAINSNHIFRENLRPETAGGKGSNLMRLRDAGFQVPPFIIVPVTMIKEMLHPSLQQINDLIASIDADDPRSIIRATDHIQDIIINTNIPEKITGQIELFTTGHPLSAFAVRSSASAEDSRDTSFAGLFKTILHVSKPKISDALREVVLSLYSPGVLGYAIKNNILPADFSMAVIIQEMAVAEVSGIIFTMNPTGNMSRMMITAGPGYGEGVVNNTTDTVTWLVDRQTKHVFRHSETVISNILSTGQLVELAEVALKIESLFGYPQDIEFSITKEGNIVILQSRDITTINWECIRILDNTNIVESYPGITRPLTFTFAKRLYSIVFSGAVRYFRPPRLILQSLREPLSEMIELVQGRVYYQLHNWYRIIGAINPSGKRMDEWEQFIGIRGSVNPAGKRKAAGKFRMFMITLILLLRYNSIMRLFYKRFEEAYQPLRNAADRFLSEPPDRKSLINIYNRAEKKLVQCWPATLLNDFFVFRIYAALNRMVDSITKGNNSMSVTQGLLCGISGVESELPVVEMLKIKKMILDNPEYKDLFNKSPEIIDDSLKMDTYSSLRYSIENYIHFYGDRTLEELKLETPNFRQDRIGFFRMVQTQLHGDNTLEKFRLQQKQIKESAENAISSSLKGKPLKTLSYNWLLNFTKATVRNRENMRLRRTRAYGAMKELFLHSGTLMVKDGLIEKPSDVFMLDFEDVMNWLNNGTDRGFRKKVTGRIASYECYYKQRMPDRIIWQGDDIPIDVESGKQHQAGGTLSGLGISKGKVTAEAIVLDHPDFTAVVDGKILVSRSTDPGWVFLMTRAAGIVCEKGSPLSHTAIVGRELGIPVIVGVPDATTIIHSGDIITMDGETGVVTILIKTIRY